MSEPISRAQALFNMADEESYDLMRELVEQPSTSEHPLDTAMRTNDSALRCYYEEHGEKAVRSDWHGLSEQTRATYRRLPIIKGTGLPSGAFFVRTYEGKVQAITEANAREHPMFAFQAL